MYLKKNLSTKIILWSIVVLIVFSLLASAGIGMAHSIVFRRYDYSSYDNEKYICYSDIAKEYLREEIEVISGDNILKGYIYGNNNENNNGLIVISPGHTDPNDIKLYEIMYFVDAGWQVLCYDYTGCYTSGGNKMNGYTQSVHDLDAVLNYIEKDEDLSKIPLMLFGHSLGAYNSCAVLQYEHSNIMGVVATSGFDTPKEQWEYTIERFTGIFNYILKPYTNIFIYCKYRDEADLSAIDGINSVSTPVLIISGTEDEFYGGESPIYIKREFVTNSNCEFRLMDTVGHNGHYNYFLTEEAARYQNKVDDDSFDEKIDKELYMEHDIEFMDYINQFFLSALSKN